MASDNFDLLLYVKLRRVLTPNAEDSDIELPSGLEAALITIEALDESENPISIFAFQSEAWDPNHDESTNRSAAFFSNVCSPNDLQELPVGLPESPDVPMFRHHTITALCRTIAEAQYLWTEVQSDVRGLVNHHKILLDPPTGTTQTEEVEFD